MFLPAEDTDLAAIAALMNRAYRGQGGAPGWSSEEAYIAGERTSAKLLAAERTEKPFGHLLKWLDPKTGALTGCIWLEPLEADAQSGVWYLGSLAAEPARQNGGQGRIMLLEAENWLRERGASAVRITVVNMRTALIAWYERRGYVRTGQIAEFPYGDNRLGTPLQDDLAFVILQKDLRTPA